MRPVEVQLSGVMNMACLANVSCSKGDGTCNGCRFERLLTADALQRWLLYHALLHSALQFPTQSQRTILGSLCAQCRSWQKNYCIDVFLNPREPLHYLLGVGLRRHQTHSTCSSQPGSRLLSVECSATASASCKDFAVWPARLATA